MRRHFVRFLLIAQAILFLAHGFVYGTWIFFEQSPAHSGISKPAALFAFLSVTFLSASLLARHYSNWAVRIYYKISAVWLGFLSFLFLAAAASWVLYGVVHLSGLNWPRRQIAFVCFGVAVAVGIYGVLNSAVLRVNRITANLENLPASWRGRLIALITDIHLGHVRGPHFAERIVRMLDRFQPDMVLIAGDMYDGTAADVEKLAQPLSKIDAPFGAFFIAGNHEELANQAKYLAAVKNSGVRVLNNEKAVVDGLQIVGVHYHDSVDPQRFRAILRKADLDPRSATILLTHAPNQLAIAAEEKIALQLSGHTHAGQFFPFTWITSRIWGPFVYGLKRLGNLLVYTSSGVGTWGPPMRVGTHPEIVLISFES